ncbi:phage tail assembly chaperone [Chromobacterium paludis]|uniref:Phage tail assembly chaperone-like domain-containing protein n=1 Tax=Chromobacterium paludis TaxID=2605945 RepID=A0A5C1DJU9_9NEIS|nr:phage tail assembly chaperone [Chromobacterium paludis]QEL57041.1 hypothetical protein FYK34_16475 [Chromobacterium paludis]
MLFSNSQQTTLVQNDQTYRTLLKPSLPAGPQEQGAIREIRYAPISKTREALDDQYTWQLTSEQEAALQQWIAAFDPQDRLVYTYDQSGQFSGEACLRSLQASGNPRHTELAPLERHVFIDGQWQADDGLLAEQARQQRDVLLRETLDQLQRHERQLKYQPSLALKPEIAQALADYAQALCDVPAQPGFPRKIIWPQRTA